MKIKVFLLCIMVKYIIIKNKYIEYVIFIKVKNRYYTYDKEDKGKYIILKGNIMEVKCEK